MDLWPDTYPDASTQWMDAKFTRPSKKVHSSNRDRIKQNFDPIHNIAGRLHRTSNRFILLEPIVALTYTTALILACNVIISNGLNEKFEETSNCERSLLVVPNFRHHRSEESSLDLPICHSDVTVKFMGFSDIFVINLVKNERLIGHNYFKVINSINSNRNNHRQDETSSEKENQLFQKNNLFLNLNNITSNKDHCHYHGLLESNPKYISAISVVEGKLLSGLLRDDSYIYHLTPDPQSNKTRLSRRSLRCSDKLYQDVSWTKTLQNGKTRTRREVRIKKSSSSINNLRHEPFLSNSTSLYVELLVVHDHSQYIVYKGDTTTIAERTMQIVNIMNAFYRQLNIYIALVGVVLWVENDEIQLSEDGDSTLTNFLKYRYEKLLPRYHHNNAQLITSTSFNGSVVGKALKGPICTFEHSGGVNTDHSHNPAIVAVTLAHELGHNFGMEHDEDDKCKCPDEKCIMSSSSSLVHPKHWSSCSIDYLEDSRKHGLLDCLVKTPEKVFGPMCGNGFVEDGEDCDLGEPIPSYGSSERRKSNGQSEFTDFTNPCCDRKTCKFIGNSTCAQGPCCDLSKCSAFGLEENRVCRKKKTECDFEEICDGKSEYCPPDVYYHDGIECGPTQPGNGRLLVIGSALYNRSKAYCYEGKCASHESQCQLLWGSSGYSSDEICYDQNVHGNTSGNCGYDRVKKLYNVCEQQDAICGMLHCVHNQPNQGDSRKTGKLAYGFESASILTMSYFVSHHAKIFCHGAIIDAGPEARDPGLVPNGAACGEEKMCLNQKCTPVYDIIYTDWCPSDCNGNGICDNTGVCHCNDGTIGSSCYQFFGANFHLSVLVYMILFFVPIIALLVFAINHYRSQVKLWWFLHNRKQQLSNKERDQNQSRRLAYSADGRKLSISEPIPLNQHNNINGLFYEPPELDPWGDNTNDGIISPGYRLEPLNRQTNIDSNKSSPLKTEPVDANMKPVRVAPPPPVHRPK